MIFKGKYMYKWNKQGDIEAIPQEQGIELPQGGIELPEEETPIKFTRRLQEEAVKERRKQTPIFTGVLNYFPDAIREIAKCSYVGQQQHNPDKPLAWDRSKSGDELDALTRHLLEAGTVDTDGIRHSAKVAWRALANLQKEIENDDETI
jgi:hypothetical protein